MHKNLVLVLTHNLCVRAECCTDRTEHYTTMQCIVLLWDAKSRVNQKTKKRKNSTPTHLLHQYFILKKLKKNVCTVVRSTSYSEKSYGSKASRNFSASSISSFSSNTQFFQNAFSGWPKICAATCTYVSTVIKIERWKCWWEFKRKWWVSRLWV